MCICTYTYSNIKMNTIENITFSRTHYHHDVMRNFGEKLWWHDNRI